MPESALALLVVAAALIGSLATVAWRTLRMPGVAPDRLVSELRLAQIAALMLALTAGTSLGLVAHQGDRMGLSLEVALAAGLFLVALIAPFRDPRTALTWVACGFGAHAILDVMHRPGLLADGLAPQWYIVGCACKDTLLGALCYLPVLRR